MLLRMYVAFISFKTFITIKEDFQVWTNQLFGRLCLIIYVTLRLINRIYKFVLGRISEILKGVCTSFDFSELQMPLIKVRFEFAALPKCPLLDNWG